MVTRTCSHVYRAVNGEFTKVARWIVLEQCNKCGAYRERVVWPESDHPNAEEYDDG